MDRIIKTTLLGILLLFLSISTIAPNVQALSITKETTTSFRIQDAINQATPGSTIQIPPGTYTETLRIDKPLHLKGYQTQTFLEPTSAENSYGIWITAQGVRLSDLSITNHATGLYTTAVKISAEHTILQNCTIQNTPIGVAIWSNQNSLTHCQFIGCEDEGIVLLGSITTPCSNNTIASCVFSRNCDGIELQYASYTTITGCRFEHHTHAGIDAIHADNNHNTINDCVFTDNQACGIYLHRSHYNVITDCWFSGDTLTVHEGTHNTLQNSTGASIHLLKDTSLTIDQCTQTSYSETMTYPTSYQSMQQSLGTHSETTTPSKMNVILQNLLLRFPLIQMLYERLTTSQ